VDQDVQYLVHQYYQENKEIQVDVMHQILQDQVEQVVVAQGQQDL
jgi:hypothetical protein|tara:strand:+ start:150 stop:284 length:135 start_codon:yes stop_codon:yes gene_type:complete